MVTIGLTEIVPEAALPVGKFMSSQVVGPTEEVEFHESTEEPPTEILSGTALRVTLRPELFAATFTRTDEDTSAPPAVGVQVIVNMVEVVKAPVDSCGAVLCTGLAPVHVALAGFAVAVQLVTFNDFQESTAEFPAKIVVLVKKPSALISTLGVLGGSAALTVT